MGKLYLHCDLEAGADSALFSDYIMPSLRRDAIRFFDKLGKLSLCLPNVHACEAFTSPHLGRWVALACWNHISIHRPFFVLLNDDDLETVASGVDCNQAVALNLAQNVAVFPDCFR